MIGAGVRAGVVWIGLLALLTLPVIAATFSPYLAFRQPVYIAAGFAGIIGLALMPLQPLAAAGYLPGLRPLTARRLHRWIGVSLLLSVVLHVVGLWLTSPPDVVDALLFRSPTPFSPFGVAAMWAILAAGLIALARARLGLPWRVWRHWHAGLTLFAVIGTVIHALLIEGAMEPWSKAALGIAAIGITGKVIFDLRVFARPRR